MVAAAKIKLNHRAIDALPILRGRYERGFVDLPGLRVHVHPTGRKSFFFHYQRSKKVRIGEFKSTPLDEVRERVADLRAAVVRGGDPADKFRREKQADDFASLAERYLVHRQRKGTERVISQYRRLLDFDVLPTLGTKPVGQISKADVTCILDAIANRGKLTMHDHALRLLRAVFQFGLSRGEVERNPTEGLERFNATQTKERFLTQDEIRAFWHGLDRTNMAEPTKIALKLMLVTGQRRNEVLGMHRDELVPDGNGIKWVIPVSRTKNKLEHELLLPQLAAELIEQANSISGDAGFVFPNERNPNRPMDKDTPNQALERAIEAGKIDLAPFTPHDLRRTVATHVEGTLGFDESVVEALLNHVSSRKKTVTRASYIRKDFTPKVREALDSWCVWLRETVATDSENVVHMPARSR